MKKNTKKQKKRIGVMDIILVFIAVSLIAFTVVMIKTFFLYGAIPDTLCGCVFTVLGGECGAMAWIKTTKERYKEREWQKADEAEARADMEALDEQSKEDNNGDSND